MAIKGDEIKGDLRNWPKCAQEINFTSSADGTSQPALFYAPETKKPVPLLVALHTWSADYLQETSIPYLEWAMEQGWAFVHPCFRGPNNKPEACGSDLVVTDVLDAVAFARQNATIDKRHIYLVGCSGGGHLALLLAGRFPEIWAAVSAWVPVVDLTGWHSETMARQLPYFNDLELCCGGKPGVSAEIDAQYRHRSVSTWLKNAAQIPVDIYTGINDGHTGSVPVHHALDAYNLLAAEPDRISAADISVIQEERIVPEHLEQPAENPAFGDKKLLFSRSSRNVQITVFDGGHEILFPVFFLRLEQHYHRK